MSNPDHLAKLLQGSAAWNGWRAERPEETPDLRKAVLTPEAGVRIDDKDPPLNLSGALLTGADLSRLPLAGADLTGADLQDANLSHTSLAGADLSFANLHKSCFDHADLAGAELIGALLSGAKLDLARNIHQAQLDRADGDETTVLPPGVTTPPYWHGHEQSRPMAHAFPPDPYAVLEIEPEAAFPEIRSAYIRLAKKTHPDLNPNDAKAELRFKQVSEAYRTLYRRIQLNRRRRSIWGAPSWAVALGLFLLAFGAPISVFLLWPEIRAFLAQAERPVPAAQRDESAKLAAAIEAGEPLKAAAIPSQMALVTEDAEEPAKNAGENGRPAGVRAGPDFAEPADERLSPNELLDKAADAAPKHDHTRDADQIQTTGSIASYHADEAAAANDGQNGEASGLAAATDAVDRERGEEPGESKQYQRLAGLVEEENDDADFDAWTNARSADSIAALQAYLMSYPNGRYADAARTRLSALQEQISKRAWDDEAWIRANKNGKRAAFLGYLKAYPNGRHADEARLRIEQFDRKAAASRNEEEAWAKARAANTEEGYRAYLKLYPKGRYAARAQQALGLADGQAASASQRSAEAAEAQPPASAARPRLRWPTSDEPFVEQLPRRP